MLLNFLGVEKWFPFIDIPLMISKQEKPPKIFLEDDSNFIYIIKISNYFDYKFFLLISFKY